MTSYAVELTDAALAAISEDARYIATEGRSPESAKRWLERMWDALVPGGLVLLEVHTDAEVEAHGARPPAWVASPGGLFSPEPHLVLTEHDWDPASRASRVRHLVVDARTAAVSTPFVAHVY